MPDIADDTTTTVTLELTSAGNGAVSGELETFFDVDAFHVVLNSSTIYTFFAAVSDGPAYALNDSYIELYDATGSPVVVSLVAVANDDRAPGGAGTSWNSTLVVDMASLALAAGDYYIRIKSNDNVPGNYTIAMTTGVYTDVNLTEFSDTPGSAVGAATERILAGKGNDTFTLDQAVQALGEQGDDQITGNGSANAIWGGAGTDKLVGLAGNDELFGDSGADLLDGGTEDDKLFGGDGHDYMLGGAGLDELNGGTGDDVMTGGGDNDTYFVDGLGDVVNEVVSGGTADTVYATGSHALRPTADIEILQALLPGGTAAINLTGSSIAQQITGNAGNNILDGKGGVDTLTGLDGDDTYIVDQSTGEVVEVAGEGDADTVLASATYSLQSVADIEVLAALNQKSTIAMNLFGNGVAQTIIGNDGANTIDSGNDSFVDTLIGRGGNDIYAVRSTNDKIIEVAGGGVTDKVRTSVNYTLAAGVQVEIFDTLNPVSTAPLELTGNEFSQTIVGNAGANKLDGGAGATADTLEGQGGNDWYIIRSSNDQIIEGLNGGASDFVTANVNYTLGAGVHVETLAAFTGPTLASLVFSNVGLSLTGNALAQNIYGNNGNDVLDGGIDNVSDTLHGGDGNDTYIVRSTNDIVDEDKSNTGIDQIRTTVDFALTSQDRIEILKALDPTGTTSIDLTGNLFDDQIFGNDGHNVLRGAGGSDILIGFGGVDGMIGGVGADVIDAGLGNDDIIYFARNEGGDTIQGFSNVAGNNDRFVFQDAAFGNLGAGNLLPSEFQSSTSNVAANPNVRFFYETDTHILRFDPDGSSGQAAIVIATVLGAPVTINDIAIMIL